MNFWYNNRSLWTELNISAMFRLFRVSSDHWLKETRYHIEDRGCSWREAANPVGKGGRGAGRAWAWA